MVLLVMIALGAIVIATHELHPAAVARGTHASVLTGPSSSDAQANAAPSTGMPSHDYSVPPVENGEVPVISRIPTVEKVAFLTIDDGIVTNPLDARLMEQGKLKATFFLVHRFINSDFTFFADLANRTGSDIENHTYDHYLLTNLTYDQQKSDICMNADAFYIWFGKRPILIRPSGGAYNDTTLRAAADCGMKALIMWDATINNGVIRYDHGAVMRPGDIVLMHFRTTFAEDLNAFVQAANQAGLQPDLLINWV